MSGKWSVNANGGQPPSPKSEFGGYLKRLLRRRGIVHRVRLEEGLEVVHQILAVDQLAAGALPDDWPAARARLDRAVHAAIRELRQRCEPLNRDRPIAAGSEPNDSCDRDRERMQGLRDRIELLPPAQRLILKLKNTGVFLPDLPSGNAPPWKPDEVDYLRTVHRPRTMEEIDEELHTRLRHERNPQDGKVPATIIAWLVGRASPQAVDTAYNAIKSRLRRSIGPIDAAVSSGRRAVKVRSRFPRRLLAALPSTTHRGGLRICWNTRTHAPRARPAPGAPECAGESASRRGYARRGPGAIRGRRVSKASSVLAARGRQGRDLNRLEMSA